MRTLFSNATVIDGLGKVLENQYVVVEDQTIVEIGAGGAPAGSTFERSYDLQGRTLMPGMIDTHLHFGGGDYDPATENDSVGLLSLRSVDALRRSLMAGFTTIRSAGAPHDLDIDARDAVNQGAIIGPRVLASGRGITMTGGHMHYYAYEADGVEEIRKATRTLIKRGADSIKIFAISAGVATEGASLDAEAYSMEEIRAAVVEAKKVGKLVQSHAHSMIGINNAIEAGMDVIDHGVFLDEATCQKMVDRGVYLVPTFGPSYYYVNRRQAEPWRVARAETVYKIRRESFRLALEMGVKIAMGSDLGAHSRMKSGENALEIRLMVDEGMTPEAAIVASTGTAAELLKLDHLIGSVEVGKRADLVVVGRNPIDDIDALQDSIQLVMRDGVLYKDEVNA